MHLRRKRSQQHYAHVVVGYWDGPYHLGTDPESVTKPHSPPSLSQFGPSGAFIIRLDYDILSHDTS